jgi:methionyl-tRNA formyltransferase
MKILFMGTPEFGVPILRALINGHEVRAVCTQPDRPKGRGMILQPSPVKQAALEAGIPVLQPETLRKKENRLQLEAFGAEVFVVAAYGLMLTSKVLAVPPLGCINVHGSLLPQYRGASPMQRSLMNGDAVTGITIMHMDKGIDTGDMILKKEIPIAPEESFPVLHDRMAALGAECIIEALRQIENGTARRVPQDDSLASYAPLIEKGDGLIDWNWPAARIVNLARALNPWPGTYALTAGGQPLKIWRCVADGERLRGRAAPGTVLAADGKRGILVQAGDGPVWLTEVQAAGKKRMPAADFLRGQGVISFL